MTVTAILTGALLVLTPACRGSGVDLFAGPLYGTSGDACQCELVNITTSTKTNLKVELLNYDGSVASSSALFSLPAGHVVSVGSPTSFLTSPVYCKFTNASPTNFRASIGCYSGERFRRPAGALADEAALAGSTPRVPRAPVGSLSR